MKALRDAGYKVFVIGLGDKMPDFLKYTLNWMAYYGGTENPLATKKGSPSALNIGAITSDPCTGSATTAPPGGNCNGSSDQCFATTNDPGTIELAGYAFISTNSKELETALRVAMTYIRDASYSFSTPSVATSRTSVENYLYTASFLPSNTDPFWKGSLKKYTILSDQSVGSAVADAGSVLQGTPAGDRKILTAKGGSLIPFTVSNLSEADLGVSDAKRRDEVVGYIRGEAADNPDKDAKENVWKLGDIFHSNPVTVGTPSAYFLDPRDKAKAFESYRNDRQRTSINEKRIIVVGANDGQLHAFRTSDLTEAWSFIPPNFLDRLKDIAHKEHPATLSHRFYVDGPITVADVWTGAGDGKVKSPGEWKTMLVVGLGQGGERNLWSSSASCDSSFSSNYLLSGEYPYYCGYHTLDITDTLSPKVGWRINPTASQAPTLGDPWSRMVIRRVRIGADEKWVGFIGGGHKASSCSGAADCDARGKGFFVVDLATGSIPLELQPQLHGRRRHEPRAAGHGRGDRFGHGWFCRQGLRGGPGGKHLALQFLQSFRRGRVHDSRLERVPVLPARRQYGAGLLRARGCEGRGRGHLALLGDRRTVGTPCTEGKQGRVFRRERPGEIHAADNRQSPGHQWCDAAVHRVGYKGRLVHPARR
jgi:hypothetical protein